MINGSPTKEFSAYRGLRQGDPLSPLIFNLVVETLHLLLQKAEEIGLIKGVSMGNGRTLTHLQFADDVIIFIDNSNESCHGIKIVLLLFEILSGLKINYQKSSLYTSKKDSSKARDWANVRGCEVGQWPISYSGASIGNSPKRKKILVSSDKKDDH